MTLCRHRVDCAIIREISPKNGETFLGPGHVSHPSESTLAEVNPTRGLPRQVNLVFLSEIDIG